MSKRRSSDGELGTHPLLPSLRQGSDFVVRLPGKRTTGCYAGARVQPRGGLRTVIDEERPSVGGDLEGLP